MYVNPFWFGFGCGVVGTIVFIIVLAVIYSMKGRGNEATKETEKATKRIGYSIRS